MRYLLIAVLLISLGTSAQDFNAASIPDSLTNDANAVIRSEELRVVIKSPSKAIIRHQFIITVLNDKADKYATLVIPYSKFRDINEIDGTLFNKDGKKLKNVKRKEILDVSNNDDGTLIDDYRVKAFSFGTQEYPYTVRYETEMEFKGVFSLPSWFPISHENVSVQESSFIADVAADYKFRFRQSNFSKEPIITNNGNVNTYEWKIQNLPAVADERFRPYWDQVFPNVAIAPSEFEYGGYTGNMSTWQDMGKYINQLYNGRSELPENVKQSVHSLTDNLNNEQEKVAALYDYLQKNTRYVSIQLGIGSLQPFKAVEVAQKKYGDCKGLSNYMISLLKEAGINAYPVIIKSGRNETNVNEDFPSNQFDHVIACVPGKDTMWLECTSQTISCGYLGSFTGNRKALLIKDDGGHMVSTPRYEVNENLQLRRIDASIDVNGMLSAEIKTHFTCEQAEAVDRFIHVYTEEEKKKHLNEEIGLPSYTIEKSEYKETKSKFPFIDEYLTITAPNYASITGKRLFIQPNLVNKSGEKLSTDKPRKLAMKFNYSYRDVDTINIALPEGYSVESMPKDVSLSSKWGKYKISFKFVGNLIYALRISERYAGTYDASEYIAFAKYMEDIYKADRSKIVLVKKE
jgi:transglutaminase-like putative cysteine protease